MFVGFVNFFRISVILIGFSVHQSKSDSIRNGIITNGANETEDSGNTALADGSIDKNAIQQQSVDDVSRLINGSTQQQPQQIEPRSSSPFDDYLSQYLASHAGATVVKPKYKKDNSNETLRIKFPEATNIEIVIHLLDINKFTNYLRIDTTPAQPDPQSFKLTDQIKPPNVTKFQFTHIQELCITFVFTSSEWSRYQGFVLTYQPLEDNLSIHANESNVDVAKLANRLNLLIEVPNAKQITETWILFKRLLANSTNKFINVTGINTESCSENNVTLYTDIGACRLAWPNAKNCIEIDFSIRLKLRITTENDLNQTTAASVIGSTANTTTVSSDYYALDRDELFEMWITFGRGTFAENGFKELPFPTNAKNTKKLLIIWSAVSLAVLIAFLLVLVCIWKMDYLRDYRRMYFNSREDEKQIRKSSDMYPPVHQIVPTLFPNDLSASTNIANALPFEFVSKPITYDISDFKRRPSLEESLQPSGIVKRKAGEVPFQSETEFNESKPDHPEEDEVYFSNSRVTSPRLVN